jgi:hypothetical protein
MLWSLTLEINEPPSISFPGCTLLLERSTVSSVGIVKHEPTGGTTKKKEIIHNIETLNERTWGAKFPVSCDRTTDLPGLVVLLHDQD